MNTASTIALAVKSHLWIMRPSFQFIRLVSIGRVIARGALACLISSKGAIPSLSEARATEGR
jgi:hypothetical protein